MCGGKWHEVNAHGSPFRLAWTVAERSVQEKFVIHGIIHKWIHSAVCLAFGERPLMYKIPVESCKRAGFCESP